MALRLAPILLALAAAGCGSSSPTLTPPTQYSLSAGTYTLNINPLPAALAAGQPVTCVSFDGGAGTSIAIPVEVRQEGPGWSVRPSSGTLRMTLAFVGALYTGPFEGSYSLGGATVTVGSQGDPAVVLAFTLGVTSLSGRIEGDVRYTASTGGQSFCNLNGWSLIPR